MATHPTKMEMKAELMAMSTEELENQVTEITSELESLSPELAEQARLWLKACEEVLRSSDHKAEEKVKKLRAHRRYLDRSLDELMKQSETCRSHDEMAMYDVGISELMKELEACEDELREAEARLGS
jgi:uncharacterized protein YukE